MKNSIKFLTILVAVFSFTLTSCDEVESLADVDFNSSISETYNLSFKANSGEAIDESITINLEDDASISKYLNKLKEVEVTKVTYVITNFTGDNTVSMSGSLLMNNKTIVASKQYDFSTETGIEYEIVDAAILKTISTTLLNNKAVTFQLKGDYSSELAATAQIKVTVYFKATANPL